MKENSSINNSVKQLVLSSDIELRINQSSIGLKSLEEIKNTHNKVIYENNCFKIDHDKDKCTDTKKTEKTRNKLLSFDLEDEEEIIPCKIFKNPDALSCNNISNNSNKGNNFGVNSETKTETIMRNIKIKEEEIAISYNYWNGSSHTKMSKCKKGTTIEQFLKKIWPDLHREFSELIHSSSEHLIFIKEDLILPYESSFFDYQNQKIATKNGLLFNFDFVINEKINLTSERPEVPLPKICLRSWYEEHKSIHPYNKWKEFKLDKANKL